MNKVKTYVLILFAICNGEATSAQTVEERIAKLQEQLEKVSNKSLTSGGDEGGLKIHGILRGKYEYEPNLGAGRFEVRNARLSAEGNLPLRSSYKLEVDLCDESAIKMKDAWVRVNPVGSFRVTLGQQRMPFSIDAHRNPSAQYFANRSFIAKQVGDMRDVGAAVGYDFVNNKNRKVLSVDAGIYNGSNLDNQKTAWFTSPAYSARIQFFPVKGLALIPSVQHQLIANRETSYTSIDFGAYYESSSPYSTRGGILHVEAEYLRKFYAKDAFDNCNAIDIMTIYKMPMKKSYLNGISYLLRYDYMDNHSDGRKGFVESNLPPFKGETGKILQKSDAERHRLTAGLTFHVANKYFPTDIRLNYEKYWNPNDGTPKESEQDKLVAELMIRF